MTENEQKAAAQFAAKWAGRGYEKGETQSFGRAVAISLQCGESLHLYLV